MEKLKLVNNTDMLAERILEKDLHGKIVLPDSAESPMQPRFKITQIGSAVRKFRVGDVVILPQHTGNIVQCNDDWMLCVREEDPICLVDGKREPKLIVTAGGTA